MPPQFPDLPPAPHPASWQGRPADAHAAGRQHRLARILAGVSAGLIVAVLLAAWAVPPLLDWGRFRTGIAAIASAQLGRPVVIGGEVTLRLLPEAVLTAADVTLPDQGDGISAQLGALRLQVALAPLLAGRIVPRDLVLGAPVLRLPWPLPDGFAHPSRPRVPHAFSAHMENGTLRIGRAEVTGINAGIHGGPEPAASGILPSGLLQPDAGAASGFGAEGFALMGGRSWRFTSALGAPDADGVSAVDLAVHGQGAAAETGGKVEGTLADGVIQGRLQAGGPDLSLLLPLARLSWRADAPFVASGERIEAASITLSLGGSPATGALALHLGTPRRLDGRVHASSLDLDEWVRVIGAARPALPGLPARLEFSADRARFLNGTLQDLRGALLSDGTILRLDQAEATLPGQARLSLGGTLSGVDGLLVTGPASIDAPDLKATLAWLTPLAPGLAGAIPAPVLLHGRLAGMASIGRGNLAVAGLSGEVDGAAVTGGLTVVTGAHPKLTATLNLDRLSLDDWLGRAAVSGQPVGPMLSRIGQSAAAFETDLHVATANAVWRRAELTEMRLDVRTGPAGLVVDHASATVFGANVSIEGAIAIDGTVTAGAASVSAPDAAVVFGAMPAGWRWGSGLWHGPLSAEATAEGPPDALGMQVRAEMQDILAEAEWEADTVARTGDGTLTLRHPGAPRLLAALGVAGAERWLDTGSVALRARVSTRPGHFTAQDFDLAAADLQLAGQLDLDLTGKEPLLSGGITSGLLALPGPASMGMISPALLQGWSAQLRLSAAQVTVDRAASGEHATASLELGGGVGLAGFEAVVPTGGKLSGQAAFDLAAVPPRLALQGEWTGMRLDSLPSGPPVRPEGGEADLLLDVTSSGANIPDLLHRVSGQATLGLHNMQVAGFDLGAAANGLALSGQAGRDAVQAALTKGDTAGFSGTLAVALAQGRVDVPLQTIAAPGGQVTVQGAGEANGSDVDLRLGLFPAQSEPVPNVQLGIHLAGTWPTLRATPELVWPVPPPARPARPAHHARRH